MLCEQNRHFIEQEMTEFPNTVGASLNDRHSYFMWTQNRLVRGVKIWTFTYIQYHFYLLRHLKMTWRQAGRGCSWVYPCPRKWSECLRKNIWPEFHFQIRFSEESLCIVESICKFLEFLCMHRENVMNVYYFIAKLKFDPKFSPSFLFQ